MSDKPISNGNQPLTLFGCQGSHTFFYPHDNCPVCGAPLQPIQSPSDAALVSHTTVRVSPAGSPFKLGLARVESGAQTLCIIEGDTDEAGINDVFVYKKDGLYYARRK